MNITEINGYNLTDIGKINIVLGKNGCGKSTMFRALEQGLSGQPTVYGRTKYITPERGGALIYEAGVEQSLTSNPSWLPDQRRKNQTYGFRQQSVAQYRRLETIVLREIERERRQDADYSFDLYISKINSLLDNIEIKRTDTTFKMYQKESGQELNPESISSGESELISLGIECLTFSKECVPDRENFLILDEPDVHLHPDLQVRLIQFLADLVNQNNFRVLIATHSTAILGALEENTDANLAFVVCNQRNITFKPISEIYRKVLPIFGAHPLSNIFNSAPILLLEGDDDERIWQQSVRSSAGRIKLYPCSVDSVTNLNDFEIEAGQIISSVYDNAVGYSLRDRDLTSGDMTDLQPIIRMKLSCRSSENLLLTDEVLGSLRVPWETLKISINSWLATNTTHPHHDVFRDFRDQGYDRKNFDLKDVRNDLMGILGCAKPWEVVVGQAIAHLSWDANISFQEEGKMASYLGEKTVKNLIPRN